MLTRQYYAKKLSELFESEKDCSSLTNVQRAYAKYLCKMMKLASDGGSR